MTVKERIKTFCKAENITVSAFEESIGVSNGYVNAISKSIGIDRLNIIVEKYSNLNIEWVLTGKGEMLKTKCSSNDTTPSVSHYGRNEYTTNSPALQKKATLIAQSTNIPNKGIPLIPIEAMAGALTCEQTVLEYECERYVVPVFKGADFLIPVKGSSMYPKYSSGDIVACQRVAMSDLFFQWNKVYVIDTTQGALIKRIKPGSDENHVLIVSDNEKYDPFELPISAIHAVALVIGVIRLE